MSTSSDSETAQAIREVAEAERVRRVKRNGLAVICIIVALIAGAVVKHNADVNAQQRDHDERVRELVRELSNP